MPLDNASIKRLIASGVHFGHKISRWNPKMKPYIFGKHNTVHIIDIKKTIEGLVKATHVMRNIARKGGLILFVGTKRQAGTILEEESKRCGMPYVSERWLGGTLTNYSTVRNRLKKLHEIEQWEKDGTVQRYTKKELAGIMREKRRLLRNLGGIRTMERFPAAVVVIDPVHERIAIEESNRIGAFTVGLIDTDGDPDKIDVVIPGNDDSMKVIRVVMEKLADAVIEGKAQQVAAAAVETKAAEKAAPAAAR